MILLGTFLSLFSSISIGLFGRFIGSRGTKYIAVISMCITVLLNIYSFYVVVITGNPVHFELGTFFSVGQLLVTWLFIYDSLASVMILMVSIISLVVHLYSCSYMKEDPHFVRFMSYLSLFTFFMLFFVSAGNLIQFFFGWEGIGICSYLLINFWYSRIQANKAALKAVLMNKIGDVGLLLSIVLIFFVTKSVDFPVIFSSVEFIAHRYNWDFFYSNTLNFSSEAIGLPLVNLSYIHDEYWVDYINYNVTSENPYFFGEGRAGLRDIEKAIFNGIWYHLPVIDTMYYDYIYTLIFLFAFIGVMSKSAQIGLHTWLPEAMEGPTPVSALIHAATMVTAGIFLLLRMSPLFESYTFGLNIMIIVGSITAFYSALTALIQNDIKKIIAYSTCSQLGYMILTIGLSQYAVSFFHLINHAFFKSLLFLTAGSVIHILSDEQDIRRMGGLAKLAPITYLMALTGTLAIIGFPFLTGFYSKDVILEVSFLSNIKADNYYIEISSKYVYFMSLLTAILTTFYSLRLLYFVFLSPSNSFRVVVSNAKESSWSLLLPLFILFFGSIFLGFFGKDYFLGVGSNTLFQVEANKNFIVYCEFLPWYVKILPVFCSSLTLLLTLFLYSRYLHVLLTRKVIWYRFYVLLVSNINFNFRQYRVLKPLLFRSYDIIFSNLDKGFFETVGPLGGLKILKAYTTFMVKFQNRVIYDYVMLLVVNLLLLFFIYYIYISFNISSVNPAYYEDVTPLPETGERWGTVLRKEEFWFGNFFSIDSLFINFCLATAICASFGCFWFYQNKPLTSLGYFFLIIVPNIVILFRMGIEYLSLILLIIYAGAIVVLFLFTLLMFDTTALSRTTFSKNDWFKGCLFFIICGFFIFLLSFSKLHDYFLWVEGISNTAISITYYQYSLAHTNALFDITIFGNYLFNHLIISVILSGLTLFIAMVGSILITTPNSHTIC